LRNLPDTRLGKTGSLAAYRLGAELVSLTESLRKFASSVSLLPDAALANFDMGQKAYLARRFYDRFAGTLRRVSVSLCGELRIDAKLRQV
jgi:hypothetical protein